MRNLQRICIPLHVCALIACICVCVSASMGRYLTFDAENKRQALPKGRNLSRNLFSYHPKSVNPADFQQNNISLYHNDEAERVIACSGLFYMSPFEKAGFVGLGMEGRVKVGKDLVMYMITGD